MPIEETPTDERALLSVRDLVVEFPVGKGQTVHAVSGVSFEVRAGETLGLVGESGSGKSTIARTLVKMEEATSGSILLEGEDLGSLDGKELRKVRRRFQMIFQDPISSLNPRRRVVDIVAEPLAIWNEGTPTSRREQASKLLAQVGIDPDTVGRRRPLELSGGQCQRVSIARALALAPRVVICDEPVSALDVSVQAQVLNLLEDLKEQRQLTLIFVAHDLAVVKNVSDRVAVMYLGRFCELAPAESLYEEPLHPYTRALLDAIPEAPIEEDSDEPKLAVPLSGEIPSPLDPPSGCRFRTRCPRATSLCAAEVPEWREIRSEHWIACHFPLDQVIE